MPAFSVVVRSLGGDTQTVQVDPGMHLSVLLLRLSVGLFPFVEVKLLAGGRELKGDMVADAGLSKDMEVQLVVSRSAKNTCAPIEAALTELKRYPPNREGREDAVTSAMPAVLFFSQIADVDPHLCRWLLKRAISGSVLVSDHNTLPFFKELGDAFGRCCGDPTPFIPDLVEAIGSTERWSSGRDWFSLFALYEIDARQGGLLDEHASAIVAALHALLRQRFWMFCGDAGLVESCRLMIKIGTEYEISDFQRSLHNKRHLHGMLPNGVACAQDQIGDVCRAAKKARHADCRPTSTNDQRQTAARSSAKE